MFKKYILPIFIVGSLFTASCSKSKSCDEITTVVPQTEIEQLQHYLDSANITNARFDSRGFYYYISLAGTDKHPGECDTVTVAYQGYFPNGKAFDGSQSFKTDLRNVIDGWRIGLPLIGQTGEITLYLPPSLGYGSEGMEGAIEPNQMLIFKIQLSKIH